MFNTLFFLLAREPRNEARKSLKSTPCITESKSADSTNNRKTWKPVHQLWESEKADCAA